MDFFSNILKNTVEKAENLGKAATAAVNSLNTSNEKHKQSNDGASGTDQQHSIDGETEWNQTNQTGEINAADPGQTLMDQEQSTTRTSLQGEFFDANEENLASSFNNKSAEMSQKAIESAKYFGNFLVNVANKAGQTVSATAKQLKNTVESVSIMQDFIPDHGGKTDMSEPPWIGCDDEEKVKTEILGLSKDKRNFVRSPPSGVEFDFDMTASHPVALALLREDPDLAKMRYEIVPKLVNEETFWKNYFYRVSLIKQDPNFTTANLTSAGGWTSSKSSSSEGPDDPNEPMIEASGETEFVSDSFQYSNPISNTEQAETYEFDQRQQSQQPNEDLDAELEKDLQEFDFVQDNDAVNNIDEDEINRELEDFDTK
ncbi:Synapse-associated protein 1 [Sarcoptes scabiei]|uniref:Synapse-associated protein 1 n=1 Tax=Sarcoptes scabiei TaxID=52283 RepID=A0A834R960_SARSC|nr:Synapse-associated protein 1 [Sarcoptes scabiei]